MTIDDFVRNNLVEFPFNYCQNEQRFCPLRWALGIWGKNTDFKVSYCQVFLQ